MTRTGTNAFCWNKVDILDTLFEDILMPVPDGPVPVNSRYLGLPDNAVNRANMLLTASLI